MQRFAAIALVLIVTGIAQVGCGGGQRGPAQVSVSLTEWRIGASPAEVRPGQVEFAVSNAGARRHQLIVIKSDLPPNQLPTADVSLDQAKVNIEGSIESVSPGATAAIELEMTPGKYILICNLIDRPPVGPPDPHYLNGMAVSFIVLDR